MSKKPNVIFFIVDSVRYYSTGGKDDRDKLEMMDRFEKESIYFPLTVTSAPSSVMSLSSMITSLPAYYIARNYDDFRYDNDQFISLNNILKKSDYTCKSLFNARELRFLFGDVIDHVDEKYWPEGTNTNQKNWSNAVVNEVLENYLNSKTLEEPFFLIVWYNVRLDPKTSDIVEEGINILKKHQIWDDSVFILGADHGYMDPKRGYTPENLKERGLSHDLLMTDDNIRIPFYLRYPGSPVKRVEQQASTLDFLPTVLSILDIPYPESKTYQMYGDNLLPLINEEPLAIEKFNKRKVRCDARFFAQADRSTALRDGRYKYVVRPDNNVEEFYDVEEDEWEENNIINLAEHQQLIEEFRAHYKRSEEEIIEFQTKYLLHKLPAELKGDEQAQSKILIFGLGEPYYLNNMSQVFKDFFTNAETLDIILDKGVADKMSKLNLFTDYFTYEIDETDSLNTTLNGRTYDTLIVLSETRNSEKHSIHEGKVIPHLKFKKKVVLNPNMEFVSRDKTLRDPKLIFKVLKQKRSYYAKNPMMIFNHFVKWIRIVIKLD